MYDFYVSIKHHRPEQNSLPQSLSHSQYHFSYPYSLETNTKERAECHVNNIRMVYVQPWACGLVGRCYCGCGLATCRGMRLTTDCVID